MTRILHKPLLLYEFGMNWNRYLSSDFFKVLKNNQLKVDWFQLKPLLINRFLLIRKENELNVHRWTWIKILPYPWSSLKFPFRNSIINVDSFMNSNPFKSFLLFCFRFQVRKVNQLMPYIGINWFASCSSWVPPPGPVGTFYD